MISGGKYIDFVNNVTYNVTNHSVQFAAHTNGYRPNIIGNYIDAHVSSNNRIKVHGDLNTPYVQDPQYPLDVSIYVGDNYDSVSRTSNAQPKTDIIWEQQWTTGPAYVSSRELYGPISVSDAVENKIALQSTVGATLPKRDLIDAGQIEDLSERLVGIQNPLLTANTKYGGYPTWVQTNHTGAAELTSNGMTAAWEASHGSNPASVKHSEGWTNIECFVHGITPD